MAASSSSPLLRRATTRTASSCTTETTRGTHVFTVNEHSLQGVDAVGKDKFIRSAAFDVGGFDWCVRYYPSDGNPDSDEDYVSVYLELMTKDAEVKTIYDIRLLDQYTGLSCVLIKTRNSTQKVLNTTTFDSQNITSGFKNFMKRSELETSVYVRDDRLMIECNLTVIKPSLVKTEEKATMPGDIVQFQVPPTTLANDFGKFLEAKVRVKVCVGC
ncbi:hypothetical protein E2562_032076 [Oryza meyeriana var. granulata]|uniref:MATH domain-containing protein n=1 Tax=Oryza meyeriana var. granulata TaxID=110450 RepID=A0A6G1CJ15_9ORYZ|nr:hypothetical protein E2562_032076 [Oryza meyeriana var. granulata]